MKKFVQGSFALDRNVVDLEGYEKPITNDLNSILEWGTKHGAYICFGTSADDTYLCEYKIVANTIQCCKGLSKELKSMLKPIFPKIQLLWEGSGDILR